MASHLERVNFYFYIYFHDFTSRLMGSGWGIKFWHDVWGSQGLVFGSFCISEFYVVEYWRLGGACNHWNSCVFRSFHGRD